MPNVLAIALLVMTSLAQATPQRLNYTLVSERAHPNLAFTQGLLIEGDQFVESSGGYGKSFLQRYALAADAQQKPQVRHLPRQDFAEGLAATASGLWLLTWQQGIAKRLDANNFAVQQVARFKGEGWGLAFDGQHLIMSDGSDQLTWRDANFQVIRQQAVSFNGQPLHRLNELEYALGTLWANVWFDPHIVAIAPDTGHVVAYVDLSPIIEAEAKLHTNGLPHHATLNGIAFNAATETFWVTGKNWRKLYEIKLLDWQSE